MHANLLCLLSLYSVFLSNLDSHNSYEAIQNLLSGSTWTWTKHVERVATQPSTPWLVYSLLFVRCCWGDVTLKGPRTLPEFWTRSLNVTPLITEEACSHGGPLTLLSATNIGNHITSFQQSWSEQKNTATAKKLLHQWCFTVFRTLHTKKNWGLHY